jgi:phosphatidylglycerophosphate synthase
MDRERLRRIRNWQSQDWYPAVFLRPLSILLMLVIADWKFVTPNRLTTAANLCKIAGTLLLLPRVEAEVAAVLGWSQLASLIAVVVLLHLGAIFDHLDGTLARYRRTFTIFGSFYDKASDMVTWTAMCMALGWRAYVELGDPMYLVLIDASAFALAIRGYLKWAANGEAEKMRWLRAKADPAAAVERATAPPKLSTPPERTAAQWVTWYAKSWTKVIQFEEMDLFFWVSLGLLIGRLDLLAWMMCITQVAGMSALFVYRHIETHGYDVEKKKLNEQYAAAAAATLGDSPRDATP